MQTFLPFPDFEKSAFMLDWRRLGKQRVEAWQILRALRGESKGWANHPAVKMWRGYETGLCAYGWTVSIEWRRRGYRDTMLMRFQEEWSRITDGFGWGALPPWFGRPDFHEAHRSNLIRKDPGFYRPLFPGTPEGLPYVWPV